MAATRENVLAAISKFVEENKRRAPATHVALEVQDTLPNVQAIIKELVTEGAITSSRGRNGGALPDGVVLEKKAKAAKPKAEKVEAVDDDTADQFAALMAKLEADAPADLFVEEAAL
jgi:hypothetical protein